MPVPDFGLGALQSPPDPRDYPIDQLYAAAGIERPVAAPLAYVIPGLIPPVLNQGSEPQCVAFSTETMKAYEDRIDQGRFFPFDEDRFFRAIGGGPNGAYLRDAFDRMLSVGYPLDGGVDAAKHRIKAYYAVRPIKEEIQGAIMAFGPVTLAMAWYWSWFSTTSRGVLRAPSSAAGGHAITAIGWDARGLRLRNSWGANWGINGDCYLPWAYLNQAWEAWKAVDVIDTMPSPLVLKYGGYVGWLGNWKVMFNNSRFRSSPHIKAGNIVRTVDAGFVFKNAQTTSTGTLVNGSRRWLGDATGNRWIHISLVQRMK